MMFLIGIFQELKKQKMDCDQYGNMKGGILSPQITAPVTTYTGGASGVTAAPMGDYSTDDSSMMYLTAEQIAKRYPKGKLQYLEEYEKAVDQSIKDGWAMPMSRERLIAVSEKQAKVVIDLVAKDAEPTNAAHITVMMKLNLM